MKTTHLKSLFIGLGITLGLFLCFGFNSFLNPFSSSYTQLMSNVELMNDKLDIATVEQNRQLDNLILSMRVLIDEEEFNEAKMNNIGLRDTLKEIQKNKDELIDLIDLGIREMEKYGEFNGETRQLENPVYRGKNLDYWLGEEKNGENLYLNMQQYFAQLGALNKDYQERASRVSAYYGTDLFPLEKAIPEKKVSLFPPHIWTEKSFSGNVLTNIAVLRALKIDVFEESRKTLGLLNKRLGLSGNGLDQIYGIAVAESPVVSPGLAFKAELLPILRPVKPMIYSSPSGVISQDETGRTFLSIRASGAVIPRGKNQGTQSYSATMKMEKPTGGFETIDIQGEFTVRIPEIEISSAAAPTLYRNCGNDLDIDVPDLGDKYDPTVTVQNARIIPSKQTKRKFRIVPNGRTCKISVDSKLMGQMIAIGSVDYKVIQPPKPTIELAVNNKVYDGSMIPKNSRVQVILIPDPDFKAAMPMEAKYGISSIDILAQLSLGSPTKVNEINTEGKDATRPISVPLGIKVRQVRPGTRVYLRLNDIYRVNFAEEKIIDRRFSEREKILMLIVK